MYFNELGHVLGLRYSNNQAPRRVSFVSCFGHEITVVVGCRIGTGWVVVPVVVHQCHRPPEPVGRWGASHLPMAGH